MTSETNDVQIDEHGVYRVGSTRVMLDSVVAAFELGHSAETIQQQYPSLSLADVYSSIAFFLRHRDEVSRYLGKQSELWSRSRAEWNSRSGALLKRLHDLQAPTITEST